MKGTAARRYINSLHHLDNLGLVGWGVALVLETSNIFDQLGDGGRLMKLHTGMHQVTETTFQGNTINKTI